MAHPLAPSGVSGFPELLPGERNLELSQLDKMRHSYESFGYASIETPAVERLDHLTAKGGIGRQIYTLGRYGLSTDAKLGLHFDLTVPLARYVAQHDHELTFPFKRYQIQKVWRGERAQRGRYREFVQCDIDVIAENDLPIEYDAEILAVMAATLQSIGLVDFTMHLSNRRILGGLLESFGVEDMADDVLREVDKHLNTDAHAVSDALRELGLGVELSEALLQLFGCESIEDAIEVLEHHNADTTGASCLRDVIASAERMGLTRDRLKLNLKIARGLDYYTGTVFETFVDGFESWGSVCSGGRYDDLAGHFTNSTYPGVGASIGHSRLLRLMLEHGLVVCGPEAPTKVLVASADPAHRSSYMGLGDFIRRTTDLSTEVYFGNCSVAAQMKYADAKGIPIVIVADTLSLDNDQAEIFDRKHNVQRLVSCDSLASQILAMLNESGV